MAAAFIVLGGLILGPYSESPGPSTNRESETSVGCSRSLPMSNHKRGRDRRRSHAEDTRTQANQTHKRAHTEKGGRRGKTEKQEKRDSHIHSKEKRKD